MFYSFKQKNNLIKSNYLYLVIYVWELISEIHCTICQINILWFNKRHKLWLIFHYCCDKNISLFIEFIEVILVNSLLTKLNLLTKLHRFKVHNSTTYHLNTVLCVHHPKSSLLPSPFIPPFPLQPPFTPLPPSITTLLSVFMRM